MSKPISKYPKPPCIKDKCLKYPVCMRKKQISCSDLSEYQKSMRYKSLYTSKGAWKLIKAILPNLERLIHTVEVTYDPM